ncbi:MAG TPA: Gfo/Idh/MocA family oxidoreductase [bacterium]|nr:Gfo/Idh/MocA family oxidoreductase [bacterium]
MTDKPEKKAKRGAITRRDLLKSAASLPVIGLLGHLSWKEQKLERGKKERIFEALQIDETDRPRPLSSERPKQLVRIGLIGFGVRGEQLSRALGFARPEWIAAAKEGAAQNRLDTRLQDWLNQQDLHVAITAVCEVFDQRREQAATAARSTLRPGAAAGAPPPPAPAVCIDYHDLVNRSDVDAVIIAAPDFQHAPMALAAIAAGKHVYVEKCMSRTEEEALALRAAMKNSPVVFQLGHQYPQNACYVRAKEIIDRNILGKITLIETSSNRNTLNGAWVRHLDSQGRPRPGDPRTIDWKRWLGDRPAVPFSIDRFYNWTKWWDYATGLSGQLYCHEVDMVNQLLGVGIPASVMASGGIYFHKDGREIPDIWNVVCEYPDHDLTHLYSASLANSRQRGRLFMGHDAAMEVGDTLQVSVDGDSTRYRASLRQGEMAPGQTIVSFRPGMDKLDAITSASEKFYAGRGLIYTWRDGRRVDTSYLHLREWLGCIRDGGTPSCSMEKAFATTITCHMATRSYREQRRVTWDREREMIV